MTEFDKEGFLKMLGIIVLLAAFILAALYFNFTDIDHK